MSSPVLRVSLALLLALAAVTTPLRGQAPAIGRQIIATAASLAPMSLATTSANAVALSQLRAWDTTVSSWLHDGDLVAVDEDADLLVPTRTHQRLRQVHAGVPVEGGDLTRQFNEFGQTESIFGVFYPDVGVSTTPKIPANRAPALLLAATHGAGFALNDLPTLVIVPTPAGFVLAWTARVIAPGSAGGLVQRAFVDAASGAALFAYNDLWTQASNAAVGSGSGVIGDRLKISGEAQGAGFLAVDLLRPGSNTTYDMKGNPNRVTSALFNPATLVTSDIAANASTTWTDPSVVSAQAYGGFTYNYYYTRFGRAGLDEHNLRFRLLVNPVRPTDFATQGSLFPDFFVNAGYVGQGLIVYGAGASAPSGQVLERSFAAGIDVVSHELTHGVTQYTSNLIYMNESGALNESFSDMMSAAVEFMFQPLGTGPGKADWLQGEDVTPSGMGLRSYADPESLGQPDHYSLRVNTAADNGGVHTNSGIPNHAYYLAIMGGTNRVSGLSVTGVGFDHRDQIEKVMYRAFTQLLPQNASFSVARAATIQAARDLYGAGSNVETAITQAWNAVGVS
jgi:thermolysin